MEIKVKRIENGVEKVKVRVISNESLDKLKEAGKKGGMAKTKKGFACRDKEELRELSRKAIAKRWGK